MKKAVDIEGLLIWAYRDQRVGELLGGGVPLRGAVEREPMGVSGDGVVAMERLGPLGCAVQGGWGRKGADVARDAETVFEVVSGLTGGARGLRALIRTHAMVGTAPDWEPCKPRCFAKHGTHTDSRDRWSAVEYVIDPHLSGMGWQPWYAEVEYEGTPEHPDLSVEGRSNSYADWWGGLNALAEYFRQHPFMLVEHVVTGFSRAPMPWVSKL